MCLHVERHEYTGAGYRGSPLLLIHGWGMHGGMWGNVPKILARHFPVLVVDLPGHGYSVGYDVGDSGKGRYAGDGADAQALAVLDDIVDRLSERFDEPLTLCGWSLGGQIAMRWASRHRHQVERLVAVASTPCFVSRTGWDHGLHAGLLQEFADSLQHDYAQTLRRFLALQVRGGEQQREWLGILRETLFGRGEPGLVALRDGLKILRDLDLRNELPDIRQPALVIAGERDMLTPPSASRYLAGHLPDARLALVAGASHALFLSHAEQFVNIVNTFMNEREHG